MPGASVPPQVTTRPPSSTRRRAVARPMPSVEPVTRQARSRRPRSTARQPSCVTTILLVRHGETDWNLQRRVQGHSDTPLNDNGRAQALALADTPHAVGLDAVHASDLARALATA